MNVSIGANQIPIQEKKDGATYAPRGTRNLVCEPGQFRVGVIGLDHGHIVGMCNGLAEAGGEICIIHPANNRSPEENAEMYLELLPFAKDCGVKIATENMWNWHAGDECSSFAACSTSESFCRHLDAVNDEFLVACLDIGHAEMRGSGSGAVNMIRALGSKLQALHLHDCDKLHDSHQIPFSMNVDFDAVVKALKEIHYSGWFTLESTDYLSSFDKDTVFTGVCNMADAAKKLAEMFDSLA